MDRRGSRIRRDDSRPTFAIAVALQFPRSTPRSCAREFIAAGGLWAMAIALILWPIRPYRPVRLRVAECYRAIER